MLLKQCKPNAASACFSVFNYFGLPREAVIKKKAGCISPYNQSFFIFAYLTLQIPLLEITAAA